jgi:uncharacterized protein YndB with AHSA1/START domain
MARIPRLRHTYYYRVPPERVFAALTDPKLLPTWFSERASVVLRKGGRFSLSWGEYTMDGRVRRVVAPNQLVVTWVDTLDGDRRFETEAQFDLAPKGKGTLLTVTHRGFKKGKRWVAQYGAIQSGWAHYLTNLRSVLEHGVDLRSPHTAL